MRVTHLFVSFLDESMSPCISDMAYVHLRLHFCLLVHPFACLRVDVQVKVTMLMTLFAP